MKIRFAMINDVFIPYLNDIRSLVILPKYCPKGYEVELECVGSFNIDPTIEPKLQDIFTEKNYGSYKGYARQYKYVDPAIAGELYIEADGNFNSDKLQRFLVDCIRVYKEDLSPFF